MEDNDKWIKEFRKQMEDYSEPVPPGLWEQLEEELKEPVTVPMWRRWQSAAAVVLLMVASALTVWFWQSPSAVYVEEQSAALEALPVPDALPTLPTEVRQAEPAMALLASSSAKRVVKETEKAEVQPVCYEEPEETECSLPAASPEAENKPAANVQSGRKTAYAYTPSRKRNERKWSVGLSTGSGSLPSNTQMNGYLPLPRSAQNAWKNPYSGVQARANVDKLVQFANLADGEEGKSDVKYRTPISFGLSLRVALDDHWAVETGVSYTQLSSETTSGAKDNNYSWEDKLHYVGIPLKLSRSVWSNRRLEVYASAGGAVEKCVYGQQTVVWNTTAKMVDSDTHPVSTELKVKPLQWSLSASAGAQFKVTERLGVYAEPGVTYYLDDGSHVNTIRKEHPVNFNLQLGMRFTLPK